MNNKIIYLNGFMAAGKSTIGPILANTLGWEFYDLDRIIENEIGKTVVAIFEEHGEKFFRDKETEALSKLSKMENAVISLGGGTVAYNNNIDILKKTGTVIYLKASPEALYKRLRFKMDRPMINRENTTEIKENLRLKIEKMLFQRSPFYEQSDFIINTDDFPLGITVDKIAKIIIKITNEKN